MERGDRYDPAVTEWFTHRKLYWMCEADVDNWADASVSLPPLTKLPDGHRYKVRKAAKVRKGVPPSTLETGGTPTDALSSKSSYPSANPSPSGHSHVDLGQAADAVHERRLSSYSSAPSASSSSASGGHRHKRTIQHASSLDSMRGPTDTVANPNGERRSSLTSDFKNKLKMRSNPWWNRGRKDR